MIRRGQLHWARLDKRRPVLVVSPDYRNDRANDVIVVPCSTTIRDAPTHVRLRRREGGLRVDCVAKCEQITTLHKDDLDDAPLGRAISASSMRDVERGILRAIGLPIP